MTKEIELIDMYGDYFRVKRSSINPDTILFHVQEGDCVSSGELDLQDIIKLRDFFNEFIEE